MSKQLLVTLVALVALAAVSLVGANVVGWTNCGNPAHATVHSLVVSGGPGSENCINLPCNFVRGNTYIIQVEATGHSGSNSLPFEIIATVLGVNITLTSGNACDSMVGASSCPAQPGLRFAFQYQYTVAPNLPPVPAMTESRVRNDDGDTTICVGMPVQII